MGIVCAGASGGLTIQQILAPDPVPVCWDVDPYASSSTTGFGSADGPADQ